MDCFVFPHCYTCAQFAGLDTIQLLIITTELQRAGSHDQCEQMFVTTFLLNQQHDIPLGRLWLTHC